MAEFERDVDSVTRQVRNIVGTFRSPAERIILQAHGEDGDVDYWVAGRSPTLLKKVCNEKA